MAALGTLCHCLTTYERSRGDRCVHDSWGSRPPAPDRHWASPHRELPLPLFLLGAVAAGLLFAGLLLLGQSAVCAAHHDQHPICEGWTPTTEETS